MALALKLSVVVTPSNVELIQSQSCVRGEARYMFILVTL